MAASDMVVTLPGTELNGNAARVAVIAFLATVAGGWLGGAPACAEPPPQAIHRLLTTTPIEVPSVPEGEVVAVAAARDGEWLVAVRGPGALTVHRWQPGETKLRAPWKECRTKDAAAPERFALAEDGRIWGVAASRAESLLSFVVCQEDETVQTFRVPVTVGEGVRPARVDAHAVWVEGNALWVGGATFATADAAPLPWAALIDERGREVRSVEWRTISPLGAMQGAMVTVVRSEGSGVWMGGLARTEGGAIARAVAWIGWMPRSRNRGEPSATLLGLPSPGTSWAASSGPALSASDVPDMLSVASLDFGSGLGPVVVRTAELESQQGARRPIRLTDSMGPRSVVQLDATAVLAVQAAGRNAAVALLREGERNLAVAAWESNAQVAVGLLPAQLVSVAASSLGNGKFLAFGAVAASKDARRPYLAFVDTSP